jgi:hypothetical protein
MQGKNSDLERHAFNDRISFWPGLTRPIHDFRAPETKDVDARINSAQDEAE